VLAKERDSEEVVKALTNERLIIDIIVVKSWIKAARNEKRASFENLSQKRESRLKALSRIARRHRTNKESDACEKAK
jgi:hypothetical protein